MSDTSKKLVAKLQRISDALLAAIEEIGGDESPSPSAGAVKKAAARICLRCGDDHGGDDEQMRRGLCVACYGNMRTDVEDRKTTEAKEIAKGLLLPAKKGGRKRRSDSGLPPEGKLSKAARGVAKVVAAHKPPSEEKGE